nr:hypothetical protein [Nitrosomonas nitrosa]
MKLPRNISGVRLIKALGRLGYELPGKPAVMCGWNAICRKSII